MDIIIYSWITVAVFVCMYIALWFAVHKKRKILWIDWIFPVAPLGVWLSIIFVGLGNQSLANVGIEGSLILLSTLFGYGVYVVVLYFSTKHTLSIQKTLIALLLFALAVTFFMPFFPE